MAACSISSFDGTDILSSEMNVSSTCNNGDFCEEDNVRVTRKRGKLDASWLLQIGPNFFFNLLSD